MKANLRWPDFFDKEDKMKNVGNNMANISLR